MHTLLVPVQLVEQPDLQDVIVQVPVPEQVSEQPPPAQERSTVPMPRAVALQLPPAQSRLQDPVLAQTSSQPPAGHDFEHAPRPEHRQGVPGLQLPELVPTASSSSPTFTFTPLAPDFVPGLAAGDSLLGKASALASLRSASAWLQASRRGKAKRR